MKQEVQTELSAPLACRYDTLKKIVRDNIGATRKLWGALAAIKEEKLYLHEYDNWESFCNDQFNLSARHADRLIDAGEIVKTVQIPNKLDDPIGHNVRNASEGEARELANIPKGQRAEVLERVSAAGPVTAKTIREAHKNGVPVDKPVPDPKEKQLKSPDRTDCLNRTIPTEVVPDWDRAVEVGNRLRSLISEVKVTISKGIKDRDLIFHEITNPTISDAEALYYTLSQILPHVVCPTCQGRGRKACMTCRGSGWISKHLYNSGAVSKATKAILEKGANK